MWFLTCNNLNIYYLMVVLRFLFLSFTPTFSLYKAVVKPNQNLTVTSHREWKTSIITSMKKPLSLRTEQSIQVMPLINNGYNQKGVHQSRCKQHWLWAWVPVCTCVPCSSYPAGYSLRRWSPASYPLATSPSFFRHWSATSIIQLPLSPCFLRDKSPLTTQRLLPAHMVLPCSSSL